MSVLSKLASALNRNDEVPNQILAQEIADAQDKAAVRELVANLSNPDKAIQSDCIKVLYEVGALQPDLIEDHVDAFVALLGSRNNRLVWGGMTALGAIAAQKAPDIWKHIDSIMKSTENGSAITQDWGVRILAAVSAANKNYEKRIFPFLMTFLKNCRPKDLPRHAESALIAVTNANRGEILALLESRKASLKPAQAKRVEQLIRKVKAI
jgi:HEAT repeat protein